MSSEPDLMTFDGYSVVETADAEAIPSWVYRHHPGNKGEVVLHFHLVLEVRQREARVRWIPLAEMTEAREPALYTFVDPEGKRGREMASPFGKMLRETMTRKEISHRAASEQLQMSAAQVSDLRMGRRLPTMAEVRALAALCGADEDDWMALAAESRLGVLEVDRD